MLRIFRSSPALFLASNIIMLAESGGGLGYPTSFVSRGSKAYLAINQSLKILRLEPPSPVRLLVSVGLPKRYPARLSAGPINFRELSIDRLRHPVSLKNFHHYFESIFLHTSLLFGQRIIFRPIARNMPRNHLSERGCTPRKSMLRLTIGCSDGCVRLRAGNIGHW